MSNRIPKIIDELTGEVITDQYSLRHRNQDDAYKRELESDRWRSGRSMQFTASNMRNLHEVYDVLTTAQCGYLMRLQCSVEFRTGRLVNSDKKAMSTTDMIKALGLKKKPSTFYDFLSACKESEIITEVNGEHYVNQRYHFRGAFSDPHVVKSYSTKVKQVYREVKAADIGLIYRMLPYVHYDTNALCDNPFEENPNNIRWFNRKELAEAIGVNPATLGRRLPKMKFGDAYVIARIKVGNSEEKYTFNPNVFYRKDTKPDDTLIAMFSVKKPQ